LSVKLVVSGSSKESRIALVGKTGKELLASVTFSEPRAKGATLRALKKILGADVVIEDSTKTARRPAKPVEPVTAIAARTADVATKRAPRRTAAAAARPRRQTTARATKAPTAAKTTRRTPKPDRSA
jgi:hypothetical protein